MKKRTNPVLLSLFLLMIPLALSSAQLPWDSYGEFYEGTIRGLTDRLYPFLTGSFPEYFEANYGAFPDFIIWDDVDDSVRMYLNFTFYRVRTGLTVIPAPAWGDTLTWAGVRPYVFWRYQPVKGGDPHYFPFAPSSSDTTHIVDEMGGWNYSHMIDLRDLPIPDDGKEYLLKLVLCDNDTIPGQEAYVPDGSWYVLRSKRKTAMDSLAWAYYSGTLMKNPDVSIALLKSFPTSRAILRRLVQYYANQENCDSLRWSARQFIEALKPGADPMALPVEGFDSMKIIDPPMIPTPHFINLLLMEVCGDSTL